MKMIMAYSHMIFFQRLSLRIRCLQALALPVLFLPARFLLILSLSILWLPVAFLLATALQAEQKVSFAHYDVHYMALNSNELNPKVAAAYGIARSAVLGYLNIALLKTQNEVLPKPTDARVTGAYIDLLGQRYELAFNRIQEDQAVYFVTTFPIANEAVYRFELSVQPLDNPPLDVRFNQKFYVN